MPKISVIIVTYNASPWIEHALESLTQQTFQNFQVLVVDNASEDKTVKIIKDAYPFVQVIQNRFNMGFSKANNRGIHFTKSDYVVTMNQDTILTERFFENLVGYMDEHEEVGSCTGKIYRLTGRPDELSRESFSKIIDTVGIKVTRSRQFIELGAMERDEGQFSDAEEIFGVSAALALYRRSALEDVRFEREYFDEDFIAYKEDVDLAWRLRLRGWKAEFIPKAVAYHWRTAKSKELQSDKETFLNRKTKSDYANLNSARNHLWVLVKCERNFWRHSPWIIWYELKKWTYILFFETKSLKAVWMFFAGIGKMRKKREQIQKNASVSSKEMLKWIT